MYQLLNTLYVTQPESYLHLDGGTVVVKIDREQKAKIPLHHLGSIVCFGPTVQMSAPLMQTLGDSGIGMVLCDANGRFKARLEGPVQGNILLRRAQYRMADDTQCCLMLSKAFIAGKIRNSRQVLLRGGRDQKEPEAVSALKEAASELGKNQRTLPEIQDLNIVRGIEGDCARRYFQVFPWLIKPERREIFRFEGRNRRPPRDRMNALLSFLYSLLMNDCRSALETAGLDPQMGFLHTVRPGRAALALDLMEEFRSILADRVALNLVNRLQLAPEDFTEEVTGAVLLSDEARKTLLIAYQEHKKEMVTHPFLTEKMPLGLTLMIQARLLARFLRGDTSHYIPFYLK